MKGPSWKKVFRHRNENDGVEFTKLTEEDEEEEEENVVWCNPEEEASWLSRLFFQYVTPLIRKGSKKTLEVEDLWPVVESDSGVVHADLYDQVRDGMLENNQRASIWRVLVMVHYKKFILAGLIKVCHDGVELLGPVLLRMLLHSMSENAPLGKSAGLATAMFSLAACQTLMINRYFHILFRIATYTKIQLVSTIYRKALRVSASGFEKTGSGKVNNLQSNDAAKLWNLPQYLHQVWNAPVKIIVIILMLSSILHIVPSLVGLFVTAIMVPLGAVVAKKLAKMRRELLKKTDARVKCVTEFVTGIKAMKLYAWEEAYMKKISDLRQQELMLVRKIAYFNIVNTILFFAAPILVALAAFWTYALMGFQLTAAVAFPALSLFNILRFPVLFLPMQIQNLINARVSFRRVQEFLDKEEKEEMPHSASKAAVEGGIVIHNGDFSWSGGGELILKNIQIDVKQGELVMIVGEVGSGKSSLLSALLGEMVCKNGSVSVSGSVAYTSQEPWIQNKSLRDNVLTCGTYDEAKYENVLEVCAMKPDLEVLPGGDLAEIGEKGINISGGQKHRIALARAVYADADIYFLDDPLSAVDAHVSRHIFEDCIKGRLENKTRILATHQVQFASQVDRIIVLKDGCIEHEGSYDELCQRGIEFHHFKGAQEETNEEAENTIEEKQEMSKMDITVDKSETKAIAKKTPTPGLIKAEERSRGRVKKAVYFKYVTSCGPFFIFPGLFITCALLERGLQVGQNFVLADWSADGDDSWDTVKAYLVFYSLLAVASMVFMGLRAFVLATGSVVASKVMHRHLLKKISSLPMSFFDSQPSGRLINRFTRDTESLDTTIGQSLNSSTVCAVSSFFALYVVCYVTPLVTLLVIPIIFLYIRVQLFYIGATRELKRLDSLAMSPIFSNFVETLQGLSVIRAFGLEKKFDNKNLMLVDHSNRAYWPLVSSNRWLSVRLEYLGSSITYGCALISVLYSTHSAGRSGLAITSAMNVTGLMTWMVRQMTELEVNMNSIERLTEYDSIASEGEGNEDPSPVPKSWPEDGSIEFHKVVVKYRPDLPAVLNGLTFKIDEMQKIGVCGRTGCGKSTMMMALYRIVEPCSGSIKIDGIDTSSISLHKLRSKLSLVPQDPVIFSGTVRSNLDPFGEAKNDKEIWDALELSNMKQTIQELPDKKGLDSSISEGGSNLSVGQRQLLCMTRALIRKSRVLILDEATSNVDTKTDHLIQGTIRSAFKNCTVLTIAHRLNTIIDSDKILVLQDGNVIEFDSPANLLKDANGVFYSLVQKATENGIKKTKSANQLANLVAAASK